MRLFKGLCLVVLLAIALTWRPVIGRAATDGSQAGVGDVNNGTLTGGDGTGSSQITINSVGLNLVKQAYDSTGILLSSGSNVTSGTVIYFVLYVDNTTAFPAADVRISDQLNEAEFTYISGSIETTIVATGSTSAAIWNGTWTSLSDSLGAPDDIASIIDSGGLSGRDRLTVGAVAGQANAILNIPASSLQAVRFRVRVN